jgi:hypothetical protein
MHAQVTPAFQNGGQHEFSKLASFSPPSFAFARLRLDRDANQARPSSEPASHRSPRDGEPWPPVSTSKLDLSWGRFTNRLTHVHGWNRPLELDDPARIDLRPIDQSSLEVPVVRLEAWDSRSNENKLAVFGDAFQAGVPVLAWQEARLSKDSAGLRQLAWHTMAVGAATHSLKFGLNSTAWGRRPDGGEHSSPSGHTSLAMSGASFVRKRYGIQKALPYYFLGAAVGASRVESQRHYVRDVLAAWILTELSAELLVSRHDEDVMADRVDQRRSGLIRKMQLYPLVAVDDGNTHLGLGLSYRY